jgi:eukaryotic-like serine/threonine-protein kinase
MTGGTQLGPYKLIEKIGAGGMGEVWKAHDTRLNRTVAIKKSAERFSERFEREAQSIAALNHPNICTLYDVGPDYLVMEYVEGHPLKGPLAAAEALPLAVQIAAALDAAHSHGIVHRDLKPGNILVQKTGVKLLDFGLARWEEPGAASGEDVATQALTGEGTILGTPQYMSPEQVEGKTADARSDIFAFGCVLYEMLTGVRAFDGASSASLVAAIIAREPRPIHELQPAVPPAVERLVRTCLAKDPAARWQSARDICHALESLAASNGAAPQPRRGKTARLAWGLAILSLAVAALLAFLLLRRAPPAPQPVRFGITAGAEVGTVRMPLISPDGRRIAITALSPDGRTRIWLRSLDSDQMRPIPHTEDAAAPFWSPDSKSIAFFSGGYLKRLDLAGGTPQTVCEAEAGFSGDWNSDGVIVFSSAQNPVRAVSARGGSPRVLTSLDKAAGEVVHASPVFLPDQRTFLFTGWANQQGHLRVGSLDGKVNLALPATGSPFRFAAPDQVLFGRENSVMAQRFRTDRLRLEGEPVRIAEPVEAAPGYRQHFPFSVSGAGVLVWRTGVASSLDRLVWRDESGAELGAIGNSALYSNPALSPDGQRLAVDIQESGAKARDIWIFDLVRGSRARFTSDPAEDFNATWSPDGTRIAFSSDRKGTRDLYVKPADGSREETLLREAPGAECPEWWTADGGHLIYNQQGLGPVTLQTFPMAPGAAPIPLPLLTGSESYAQGQISPDGKYFAYRATVAIRSVIYVQEYPPKGHRWQISPETGTEPQWRRDGRVLYFVDRSRPDAVLLAVDVDTSGGAFRAGRPRKILTFRSHSLRRNMYLPAPGNRLLVVEQEVEQPRAPITVLVNWQAALVR